MERQTQPVCLSPSHSVCKPMLFTNEDVCICMVLRGPSMHLNKAVNPMVMLKYYVKGTPNACLIWNSYNFQGRFACQRRKWLHRIRWGRLQCNFNNLILTPWRRLVFRLKHVPYRFKTKRLYTSTMFRRRRFNVAIRICLHCVIAGLTFINRYQLNQHRY